MYVHVMCTGDVLADISSMREQAKVLADEYALNLVERTESDWISMNRPDGNFTRHFRVCAYPKATLPIGTDDIAA